jgi:hypothetical protein
MEVADSGGWRTFFLENGITFQPIPPLNYYKIQCYMLKQGKYP